MIREHSIVPGHELVTSVCTDPSRNLWHLIAAIDTRHLASLPRMSRLGMSLCSSQIHVDERKYTRRAFCLPCSVVSFSGHSKAVPTSLTYSVMQVAPYQSLGLHLTGVACPFIRLLVHGYPKCFLLASCAALYKPFIPFFIYPNPKHDSQTPC